MIRPFGRELHFSDLKQIARSPMHFRHSCTHKRPDTPSMFAGRVVHSLVLGGPMPVVWDGDRRGKAWTDFAAAHEGEEIMRRKEIDECMDIADAVLSDPVAAPILTSCTHREEQLVWERDGLECGGRIDGFGADFVIDLKTAAEIRERKFRYSVAQLSYAEQLVWYAAGLRSLGLSTADRHYLIAVEKEAPYPVVVYETTPMAERAERVIRTWIERLLVCHASDEWPGYAQRIVELHPYDGGEDE